MSDELRELVAKWPHRRKMVDGQKSLVECMPSCHRCEIEAVLSNPQLSNERPAGGTIGLEDTRRDWETDGPAWEKRALEAEAKLADAALAEKPAERPQGEQHSEEWRAGYCEALKLVETGSVSVLNRLSAAERPQLSAEQIRDLAMRICVEAENWTHLPVEPVMGILAGTLLTGVAEPSDYVCPRCHKAVPENAPCPYCAARLEEARWWVEHWNSGNGLCFPAANCAECDTARKHLAELEGK